MALSRLPPIKVKTDLGDEYILQPGQGFRLDNRTFGNLQITNAGGVNTIIGQVLIADGGFFDNRVTGSVEVIDGGKNRTMAGVAFIGAVGEAPGSGQNTSVQLWNPYSNTKNLIVPRLTASSSNSGGSIGLYRAIAALPTAQGNGKAKKLGGPISSALMYSQVGAAMSAADKIYYNTIQGGLPFLIVFAEPIVVPPGFGITAMQALTNNDLQVTYEWYEESV